MIGKLKGKLDSVTLDSLIIDVNGVGYIVFASATTLRNLPPEGEYISLLIETHVREDHLHLYGFSTQEEKEWFSILTTVKGVGNKVALAILSAMLPNQISIALASQDVVAFTAVSGIGKKMAERIVTELKDKAGTVLGALEISSTGNMTASSNNISDAVLALTSLGYGRSEVFALTSKIASENADITVENLIKLSLKEL